MNGRRKVFETRSEAAAVNGPAGLLAWYERTIERHLREMKRAMPKPRPQQTQAKVAARVRARMAAKGDATVLTASSVLTGRAIRTALVWMLAFTIICMVQSYDN